MKVTSYYNLVEPDHVSFEGALQGDMGCEMLY